MAWASGTSLNQANIRRIMETVPGKYTVHQCGGSSWYATTKIPGGTNYGPLSNPFEALQDAVDALNSQHGRIYIKGSLVQPSASDTVEIDSNAIEFYGDAYCGDLYFTNDNTYHGFTNKWPSTIIAPFANAFEIGNTTFCFGTTFTNLGFSGLNSDAVTAVTTVGAASAIRIKKGNTIAIRNCQFERFTKGLHIERVGAHAFNNVIDNINFDNLLFTYNIYGLYQAGWTANVRGRNIYGYINQKSLIKAVPQYDWRLDNIFSNADSWNTATAADGCISIETNRDVTLSNIKVAGSSGGTLCPVPLLYLAPHRAYDDPNEWCRAHILVNGVQLQETQSDAVRVAGSYGRVDLHNLNVGPHPPAATQGYYGGAGTVTGSVVNNTDTNVEVYVHSGYAKCSQASKSEGWFIGCKSVKAVASYNPLPVITNAWNETDDTVGLEGIGATFTASTDYTVWGTDIIITSSGGTGVSFTIKDSAGGTIATGMTTLTAQFIPAGCKVNFGGFSGAPTVIVAGA